MGSVLRRASAWNGPLVTSLAMLLALATGLLIIRLSPLGAVLFAVLAIAGVATLIEPLAGVAAALFLGLLWAYLHAEVPQIPDQIGQGFVALALAAWLAHGLARRELCLPDLLDRRRGTPLFWPLLLYLGAALFSLWDAVELPVFGLPELIKWVQVLLLFFLVYQRLTPRRVVWLLGVLLATGVFQAAVGVWQFGLRGDGPEHFAILGEGFYRAYGTFEQPNPYAGYLGLTLPVALGVAGVMVQDRLGGWIARMRARETRRSNGASVWQIALVSGAALAMLVALLVSWSRGAWMGFGAAMLAIAVALPRRTRWGLLLVTVLVIGGLGLATLGLIPGSVMERLTGFTEYVRFEDVRGVGINTSNYAVIERLAHWQAALEMFRYNPWNGVGFGCYGPAYVHFDLVNWPIALGHAHNYYLNTAAETGIVGLVAYLALWGAVFWQTWRATRRSRGLWRGIAVGLLGSWTHLSVHHLLDNLYVNNVHLHVAVMLGMLAVIVRQTNETIPEGERIDPL